jgi:hypothetical protein
VFRGDLCGIGDDRLALWMDRHITDALPIFYRALLVMNTEYIDAVQRRHVNALELANLTAAGAMVGE